MYNTLKLFRAAKKKQCTDSFYEFVKYMWDVVSSDPFQFNFHIKYLCNELQEVGLRVARREEALYDVIINISPGETKTIIVSQMFNAWLFIHNESIRFLGSSHTHSLSEHNSMVCQDIIMSEKFVKTFGPVKLKENKKGKSDFMTAKNGRRKSASVNTRVTGTHYDIIAFDDLVDAEQELSFSEIEAAKAHMTKCWSRKTNEKITVFILVMQRVTSNDPTTYFKVLSTRPIKHIRLPAESTAENPFIVSPPELKQYYKDGIMNPHRKGKDVLKQIKKKGTVIYNAQYGQSPDELKGKIAKRDNFIIKKLSQFAAGYFSSGNKLVADTAYTEDDKNDPSGFLICTYKDSVLYLLDFYEFWLEYPEALDKMAYLMSYHGCNAAHVENKASGKSLAQGIRKMKELNAIDYNQTKSDKRARLIDALPMIEAHRVVIVLDDTNADQMARMEYFLSCVTNFPDKTIHDESVDTLVMAIKLSDSGYEREWN